MAIEITRAQARRLFLQAQGLDGRWAPGVGAQGVLDTVQRLSYVQIDTISVVERAHHHTLWARQPAYEPDHLDTAHAGERGLFEYWYPAASYIPIHHYRYCLPIMRDHTRRHYKSERLAEMQDDLDTVRDRIRDEGGLGSADFEAPPDFQREGWWSWKPAKQALEYLFTAGELMVRERRSFQRIYDLRERVLPADVDTSWPSDAEMGRFLAEQALDSMGIAGGGNTRWQGRYRTLLAKGLQALAEEGQAVPVSIAGIERDGWYTRPEALACADALSTDTPRLHILSPFDNLVIHRDWLATLFGMDYTLECYVPKARRRYGYFVLPILWGERFIARVDAKADRKAETLLLQRLEFEADVAPEGQLLRALAEGLWGLAGFNGCNAIDARVVAPEAATAPLVDMLAQCQPACG